MVSLLLLLLLRNRRTDVFVIRNVTRARPSRRRRRFHRIIHSVHARTVFAHTRRDKRYEYTYIPTRRVICGLRLRRWRAADTAPIIVCARRVFENTNYKTWTYTPRLYTYDNIRYLLYVQGILRQSLVTCRRDLTLYITMHIRTFEFFHAPFKKKKNTCIQSCNGVLFLDSPSIHPI